MRENGETPTSAVLLFGGRRVPRPLRGLPLLRPDGRVGLDAAVGPYRRLVVGGADADQAAVLTELGFALAQGYHYSDSHPVSELINDLNQGQGRIGGSVEREYAADGARVTIRFPIAVASEAGAG